MTARDVFISYQKAKADYLKRGWRVPTNWDKVEARRDWQYFEELASRARALTIDVDAFLTVNMKARKGKLLPVNMLSKAAFKVYQDYLKAPPPMSETEQLKASIMWLAKYLRKNNMTVKQYFSCSGTVFPVFLNHYMQRKIHRWLLAYSRFIDKSWFKTFPSDVIEYAFDESAKELDSNIDAWMVQLIHDQKSMLLIKKFWGLANGG